MLCSKCGATFKHKLLLYKHLNKAHKREKQRNHHLRSAPSTIPANVSSFFVLKLYFGYRTPPARFTRSQFPLAKVRYSLSNEITEICDYLPLRERFPT